MVVYLDVLFGVNTLMDYTTLLAAARLGGVSVERRTVTGGGSGRAAPLGCGDAVSRTGAGSVADFVPESACAPRPLPDSALSRACARCTLSSQPLLRGLRRRLARRPAGSF